MNKSVSEEQSDKLETITFGEESNLEAPKGFPLSSKIQVVFLFLAWLETCVLLGRYVIFCSRVSLMHYSIFHKLDL